MTDIKFEQKPMKQSVQELTKYMETYPNQYGYESWPVDTLIDDVLYGLGVSISDEYRFADGYDKFKKLLLDRLQKEEENRKSIHQAIDKLKGWNPIETAPKGAPGFLALCKYQDSLEWLTDDSHPDRFFNMNSGNYTERKHWAFWKPLPEFPPELENVCQDKEPS